MAERFFVDQPLGTGLVAVTGPEAHHMLRVRRLGPGDEVCLFNGDGQEYTARVDQVSRRHVAVEVVAVQRPERELGIVIEVAAPLPKGDRSQFLVEKLTELGVTSLVPLSTERSVIQPRDAKLEKLQRYVIEASKQCGRNVLMRVEPLAEWPTYCRRADVETMKILAHPHPHGQSSPNLPEETRSGAFTLAVGPEGGFSAEEVALAQAAGWNVVDLGPRILRVETAALVLATLVAVRGSLAR